MGHLSAENEVVNRDFKTSLLPLNQMKRVSHYCGSLGMVLLRDRRHIVKVTSGS